jgi:hypothetical protein
MFWSWQRGYLAVYDFNRNLHQLGISARRLYCRIELQFRHGKIVAGLVTLAVKTLLPRFLI